MTETVSSKCTNNQEMQGYTLTHTTYLEPNADTDREDGTW